MVKVLVRATLERAIPVHPCSTGSLSAAVSPAVVHACLVVAAMGHTTASGRHPQRRSRPQRGHVWIGEPPVYERSETPANDLRGNGRLHGTAPVESPCGRLEGTPILRPVRRSGNDNLQTRAAGCVDSAGPCSSRPAGSTGLGSGWPLSQCGSSPLPWCHAVIAKCSRGIPRWVSRVRLPQVWRVLWKSRGRDAADCGCV